jgi:uncharacterized membrane protein YfcA
VLLAVPGIAGTSLGAAMASHVPGAVQLVMLAGLMLVASVMMFRGGGDGGGVPRDERPPVVGPSRPWVVAAQGLGLGMVTGLVGVGGGFLIVPVLVLLRGLAMPTAVGTSLMIIAVNSAAGLFATLVVPISTGTGPSGVDWSVIGIFAAIGIAGNVAGSHVAGRIPQGLLKRIFAVFLIVMAVYILARQAPRVWPDLFGAGG